MKKVILFLMWDRGHTIFQSIINSPFLQIRLKSCNRILFWNNQTTMKFINLLFFCFLFIPYSSLEITNDELTIENERFEVNLKGRKSFISMSGLMTLTSIRLRQRLTLYKKLKFNFFVSSYASIGVWHLSSDPEGRLRSSIAQSGFIWF